jgi:pilus assembly protein CpaB
MKTKTWLPIAVAVVLGIFAAVLAKNAMSKKGTPAAAVKIVVAKRAIAPGEALMADDLELRAIAAEAPPEGAQTDPAILVGRTAQAQVVKGQPIVESLLAAQGSASGLQALVPPGMRAMTIEVNEFSAVGGMITPGSRVDVLSTMLDAKSSENMSRTIAQNVLVKAVGQATGQAEEAGMEAKPVRSITLLVTSRQAEALQLSTVTGRPWLVLRGQNDNAIASSAGTTLSDLRGLPTGIFGAALPPQAAPVPDTTAALDPTTRPVAWSSARSVHTIRGTVENTVTVAPLQRDPSSADVYSNTQIEP